MTITRVQGCQVSSPAKPRPEAGPYDMFSGRKGEPMNSVSESSGKGVEAGTQGGPLG